MVIFYFHRLHRFFAGCVINLNARQHLPDPQPLFVVPGTNRFHHPNTRNGFMRLNAGHAIELVCSRPGFVAPFNGQLIVNATCVSGTQFRVGGRVLALAALRCAEHVAHTARHSRSGLRRNMCPRGASHIEIGFTVASRFLWTMDVCHDERLEHTHFVYHRLAPEIGGYQRSIVRPTFQSRPFFGGRDIDYLYTGNMQRRTIGGIIGAARVRELWNESKDYFLARGHLAARSDFVLAPEQRSTFHLINAAPQWHNFNAGNWESVESSVQRFVTRRNLNVDIYTGTWGTLRFADTQGVQRPLFLNVNQRTGASTIPVPALYYKVVIAPSSRLGVVFVGVNNPHAVARDLAPGGQYRLCNDVASRINWVNWDARNVSLGFSYACTVNDFVRAVGHLPSTVHATGLLV